MKNNKGITLIALVVTIIVLLILAGVAIAMLRGDNGILNRASEAKYDNIVGSVNEQVKLAQMSTRTMITSNMVSEKGYIATKKDKFIALKDAVVTELNAKEAEPGTTTGTYTNKTATQEGYIVYSYLSAGDDHTDGEGFIVITYSDNALRSSLTKNVEGTATSYNINGITFKRAFDNSSYSVNQAVLAYVIRVTNYNCTLSNAILTDSTARGNTKMVIDADSTLASATNGASVFCTTSTNATTGEVTVVTGSGKGTTIGQALEF